MQNYVIYILYYRSTGGKTFQLVVIMTQLTKKLATKLGNLW